MNTAARDPEDGAGASPMPLPPLVTQGVPPRVPPSADSATLGPLTTGGERAARRADRLVEGGESGEAVESASETGVELPSAREEPLAYDQEPGREDELLLDESVEQWEYSDGWGEGEGSHFFGEAEFEEDLAKIDLESSSSAELISDESEASMEIQERSISQKDLAVEEVAERLERIARALRAGGPEASLTEHPGDALNALITGYLLGITEERGRKGPSSGE